MKKMNLSLNLKNLKALTPATTKTVAGGVCNCSHAP